uniref:Cilia and flagella associated protein 20 n=1 Tax=Nothoprocta perdicaria TaxID=30464 RepID=A0A8C6Z9G5_NOTPE
GFCSSFQPVRNGHIKRITDNDIQSLVLEIEGTNVSTTYITCPADPKKTLGIKLPFLVMIIKNLKKYFTFEVQVLDDKNVRRRFRASNYQSTTRVKPFICTMPMRLDDGWNQIQFNLSDFTRRAYGTNYIETLRVQIHANCRIRRVYFSDRLYSEDELPAEFKLYLPVQNKAKVRGPRVGRAGAVAGPGPLSPLAAAGQESPACWQWPQASKEVPSLPGPACPSVDAPTFSREDSWAAFPAERGTSHPLISAGGRRQHSR